MRSKKEKLRADPEFGLDSRYRSNYEEQKEAIALMQARIERMKAVSEADILKAKLMQLKFQMEDYLNNKDFVAGNYFTRFLENYIDILYEKKIDFAADLNITANFLSKTINRHVEPNHHFILRLMIHSEKVYKQICQFKKEIWYQIYFKDKIAETMNKEHLWFTEIEREINYKNILV